VREAAGWPAVSARPGDRAEPGAPPVTPAMAPVSGPEGGRATLGDRVLRVMGVDPGLMATGFAVLEARPGEVAVADAGVISTSAGQALEARLNALHAAVHRIIDGHKPSLLIVEDLYTEYKFPRTAVLMGHARGVIYLAARQLGVAVLALAPSEVKRAVTGNGSAGKAQVQRAVQTLLGLDSVPRPSHVADALGLAVTGMARITGRLPAGRATRPSR
jgi:crossover junction endodeoxyribonuclease RuvC